MSLVQFSRRTAVSLLVAAGLGASAAAVADNAVTTPTQLSAIGAVPLANRNITEAEVLAAQQAWGRALVQISTDYETGGLPRAKATAEAVLDSAYGYSFGPVLFKPTLTTAPQTFRTTRDGALAYFVGDNPSYPNDKGFALKGWRSFEIRNTAIQLNGNTALTMGNVVLKDAKGNVTTVDKTWGYVRDDKGNLRIVLHHSSLPVAK